jgi:hypothetical protein
LDEVGDVLVVDLEDGDEYGVGLVDVVEFCVIAVVAVFGFLFLFFFLGWLNFLTISMHLTNPLEDIINSPWYHPCLLRIQRVPLISHHRKSLTSSGLPISKNGGVFALKHSLHTWCHYLLIEVFLGTIPTKHSIKSIGGHMPLHYGLLTNRLFRYYYGLVL